MFKKLLSLILLASISLSLPAINASAQTKKPKNLLLFGDSISTGYGLSDTEKNFGCLLYKSFGLTDSCYTNLAVNGATSADVLTVVKKHTKEIAAADSIILTVGGNDILGVFTSSIKAALGLPDNATSQQVQEAFITKENAGTLIEMQLKNAETQSKFTAAQSSFSKNLLSIVTAIKTANPSAKLYIQTIYSLFGETADASSLSNFSEKALSQMNTVITGNAEKNYTVIDTYSAFKGKALTLTNIAQFDFHPNEEGHEAIFKLAYRTITGESYTATNAEISHDVLKSTKSVASSQVPSKSSSGSDASSTSHIKSTLSSDAKAASGNSITSTEVSSSPSGQPESIAEESSITTLASSAPTQQTKKDNGSTTTIVIVLLIGCSTALMIVIRKRKISNK